MSDNNDSCNKIWSNYNDLEVLQLDKSYISDRWCPEKRLFQAVLEQSLIDIRTFFHKIEKQGEVSIDSWEMEMWYILARASAQWIKDEDMNFGGFQWTCEILFPEYHPTVKKIIYKRYIDPLDKLIFIIS